ncbi:hypothetical protein DERP_009062 [Dermatophagoides pteronyssinus]|uniref:Uncharacterized protein n=1 Tax=Dermatophagoides pteronyssinus TaxID=6956 RepID=A0ABQ8JGB2_DERPT|nr:hypothetical protein DERP_009062 [Dermatophagoides pteronyssinus]
MTLFPTTKTTTNSSCNNNLTTTTTKFDYKEKFRNTLPLKLSLTNNTKYHRSKRCQRKQILPLITNNNNNNLIIKPKIIVNDDDNQLSG